MTLDRLLEFERTILDYKSEVVNKIPPTGRNTEYYAGVLDAFQYIISKLRHSIEDSSSCHEE